MTELNTQVDAGTTVAAQAEVAEKKKSKNTVKKADLTVAHVTERLELRDDVFDVDGEQVTQKNFYWKIDTPTSKAGDFAGSRRPLDNYYSVVLLGTNYSGKQLAHFVENGVWPEGILSAKRGTGAAKEKVVKEHVVRVAAAPLSAEARKAALDAAKAKAATKKAEKEAKAKAEGAGTEQASEDPAATSDIGDADSVTL